jgi:hypothetical protein
MFFILHEKPAEKPRFERAELDCTQCHIAAGTRGVPGVLLRSVQTNDTGSLIAGARSFITDQNSPLEERWGGWYATGAIAGKTLANTHEGAPAPSFTPSQFLTPASDEVALLVLAHQTQMHNLITLTNYKTRIALHAAGQAGGDAPVKLTPEARRQFEKPAEQLLRYLLFVGEAPLPNLEADKIIGTSAYAREFAARGPRDSKGRSLRDFDLRTRTFRYPLSYLIYSDDFDALPEPARGYVYSRLLEILTAEDPGPDFKQLSTQDRRAILDILLETKPGLPREWQTYARVNKSDKRWRGSK